MAAVRVEAVHGHRLVHGRAQDLTVAAHRAGNELRGRVDGLSDLHDGPAAEVAVDPGRSRCHDAPSGARRGQSAGSG